MGVLWLEGQSKINCADSCCRGEGEVVKFGSDLGDSDGAAWLYSKRG